VVALGAGTLVTIALAGALAGRRPPTDVASMTLRFGFATLFAAGVTALALGRTRVALPDSASGPQP
jgi:hypothetical protein